MATPGLLFDWALPLLAPTSPAGAADVGVQFAALSALRECMWAADDVTLARYATVTFDTCQKLLEDERTLMQLLPPLLGVLTQVKGRAFTVTPLPLRLPSQASRSRVPNDGQRQHLNAEWQVHCYMPSWQLVRQ